MKTTLLSIIAGLAMCAAAHATQAPADETGAAGSTQTEGLCSQLDRLFAAYDTDGSRRVGPDGKRVAVAGGGMQWAMRRPTPAGAHTMHETMPVMMYAAIRRADMDGWAEEKIDYLSTLGWYFEHKTTGEKVPITCDWLQEFYTRYKERPHEDNTAGSR